MSPPPPTISAASVADHLGHLGHLHHLRCLQQSSSSSSMQSSNTKLFIFTRVTLDLSVTLDLHPSVRFFFTRCNPFITASTISGETTAQISISCETPASTDSSFAKHTLELSTSQIFLCYSSSPLNLELSVNTNLIAAGGYAGVLQVTFHPDPSYEYVLDQYSSCYLVPDPLLLAHPLHLRLLDPRGRKGGRRRGCRKRGGGRE